MAIRTRTRKNGKKSYQVRTRDKDGIRWITKTFSNKKDAQRFEREVVCRRELGQIMPQEHEALTINIFFKRWMAATEHQISPGWKKSRLRMFSKYVSPHIGDKNLCHIKGEDISITLHHMKQAGLSNQMIRHCYSMLRKMFQDGIELFEFIERNPVKPHMKPKVEQKESPYLTLAQSIALLKHSKGKEYGLFVWLGLLGGLRVGEIQPLKWSDFDFEQGVLRLRRSYSKTSNTLNSFTKSKKVFNNHLPDELVEYAKSIYSHHNAKVDDYVFASSRGNFGFVGYTTLKRKLAEFCKTLSLPNISPHGLRHSASLLFLNAGATKDDIQHLLHHSSSKTTERYLHDHEFRQAKQKALASNVTICDHFQNGNVSKQP